MTVGCSAHTVPLPASGVRFWRAQRSDCHVIKGVWAGVDLHVHRAELQGPVTCRRPAQISQWHEIAPELASSAHNKLAFVLVMSASVKPRLAGRQPSNRGGVPRVMTGLSSHNRLSGKRGSGMTGP